MNDEQSDLVLSLLELLNGVNSKVALAALLETAAVVLSEMSDDAPDFKGIQTDIERTFQAMRNKH